MIMIVTRSLVPYPVIHTGCIAGTHARTCTHGHMDTYTRT